MGQRNPSTQKKVDAILTADWHLRETAPICRLDDFITAQINKMKFIRKLQKQYECPVIHAGDLFHSWKPSPFLLTQAFLWLPEQFYTVYGNHDLPQHNVSLAEKTGIYTLATAGRIQVMNGVHWNANIESGYSPYVFKIQRRDILVLHAMTWKDSPPWPGCSDSNTSELLDTYDVDLIVTGHNHRAFIDEKDGKLLVNPGSLTRQTADQIDFKPRVYLWHAETNTVTPEYLPIEKGVISREHIEHKEERDIRIQAFIEKLNNEWNADLSFEANLERFQKENSIRRSVMDIIYAAIESEKI